MATFIKIDEPKNLLVVGAAVVLGVGLLVAPERTVEVLEAGWDLVAAVLDGIKLAVGA